MLAVSTACYFLLLALMLYELDRQHFTSAKQQIIRDNFYELFPPLQDPRDLRDNAWEALYGSTQSTRADAQRALDRQFAEIVEGPTSIYEMTLRDAAGQIVIERRDPAKVRRMNTLDNCLFLRGFSGLSDQPVSRQQFREGGKRIAGRMVARYATPPNYPPMRDLVVTYRVTVAGVIVIWCALYVALYRYLLRPMQLVTYHLEESRLGRPRIIPRASGLLESSYNALANLAIQQQLQERLMGLVRLGSDKERDIALAGALAMARESFGIEHLALCEIGGEHAHPALIDWHASPPEIQIGTHALSCILQQFASAPSSGGVGEFRTQTDGDFAYLVESRNRRVMVFGRLKAGLPDHAYRLDCARQAAEALSRGLLFYRAHQIDMYRQRSEANIVLSKNLGHDLTNIIATTKLDLMAVRQLLDSRSGDNGSHDELLKQAVDGVLKSTRFLQEIVNLYRSFSYVKRPQYERQGLTDVIGQFLDAYEPTVSSRIAIRRELQPGMPTLILEPRLLKLALFNLVSNAIDAIRRSSSQSGGASPAITVRAEWQPDDRAYSVVVQDNGPGICDKSGRLLDASETDMIFEYGYSTKAEQSEGLGLNWVRTIIVDFHAGAVRAENLPQGGAAFHLTLRSMESSEAKIGSQNS